eukprot:3088169-Prymnesium_polylepis.2
MPADPSVFMGEAGLFHQLSGDMLDRAGVPSEVTLGHDGELHVTKELVCCHMPPFKNGCAAHGKQIKNLGGDSAQGVVVKRNAYHCRNCHSKWSMIHPAQLQLGQDPMVNTDCKKAVTDDDPKRAGGYRQVDSGLAIWWWVTQRVTQSGDGPDVLVASWNRWDRWQGRRGWRKWRRVRIYWWRVRSDPGA